MTITRLPWRYTIGFLLGASLARAVDVPVSYTVDEEALRRATSGTPMTFELHADAACSAPIHTDVVPVETIRLIERVKALRIHGAAPPPRVARLNHVLTGVPSATSYFLKVTGTNLTPVGGDCQPQAGTQTTTVPCATQVGTEVYFTGCNVNVRNGLGATTNPNGLGNLVVGYNDPGTNYGRDGSHNVVIGDSHTYRSTGGLVAGYANGLYDQSNSVTGGTLNAAQAKYSSVCGGISNSAGAYTSSGGGTVPSIAASVTGGRHNWAIGDHAAVSGGADSMVWGADASVSGGEAHQVFGQFGSVSGGKANEVDLAHGSVTGGQCNAAGFFADATPCATLTYAPTVTGGAFNVAQGTAAVVSGGRNNAVFGDAGSVSGGTNNFVSATQASISGGENNAAFGTASSISGGNTRATSGTDDWVAGTLFEDF
jgi:hypothetical protein